MLLQAKAYAYSSNKKTREKHKKLYSLYDWVGSMVVGILIVFFIYTFFITSNTVDGHSMEPTFMDTERLFMVPTFYKLEHGDVVVVAQDKVEDLNAVEPLLKRVIGMEGDKINIDFNAGVVYVNDVPLDEKYTAEPITLQGEDVMTFPLTVPENCIFVLGDNRNNSRDSRNESVGVIDKRYIYGKVVMRYWPVEKMGIVKNPYTENDDD